MHDQASNAGNQSRTRRHGVLERVFPQYTPAEAIADRAIHLFTLPAAIGAVGWLFLSAMPTADTRQAAALAIYGCGLIGMLTASAAYNLSPPCRRKELLRRLDRAMIFVMIAGTWSLAAIGAAGALARPRRFERPLLVLYLVMGWL